MPVDFRFSHDLTAFRADVRSFFEAEMAPGRVMGHLDPSDLTGLDEAFERQHHRSAGAAGFLGISAPADLGGSGRPPSFRALYLFEAAYRDAPSIDTAIMLCGPPLLAFGNRQQQARWVPPMVRGEITGCIAYTEPGAGSDLAAISTRAIADGSMWVLNGRKALVTGAHKADMCVTVALTDASVAARRAMSMFVLPLDLAGITVRRRPTVNGWTLAEIDFDNARLPAEALLGELHGGWAQLTGAVVQERSGMAHLGWATRILDRIDDWTVDHPDRLDTWGRDALGRLHVDLATGLRLASLVMWGQDHGGVAPHHAAAAKVFATELLQRVARVGSELVGIEALEYAPLFDPRTAAPLGGRLAWEVLERIHPTISVGANEVQRDLIARSALGLSRHRGG
ncbi:MAG TPA: acyl-CoA dehydrogenase family protein [Acidimicrobiales bacterium]